MLMNVADGMEMYGSGYSNWALLLLRLQHGISKVEAPKTRLKEVQELVSPFILLSYTNAETFRVCANGSCSLPLESLEDVYKELESNNVD
jgi:hypothetical protein